MDILQLIEELEDVIDDASNVPFSKKIAVDPDEISEIVREIRESLPEEIRQAKWVNDEKDRIMQEAQDQAQSIVSDAQKRAADQDRDAQEKFNQLVNDNRITKMANKQAEEIVSQASKEAAQIRKSVFAYVDELLANTQTNLSEIVKQLDANRKELK